MIKPNKRAAGGVKSDASNDGPQKKVAHKITEKPHKPKGEHAAAPAGDGDKQTAEKPFQARKPFNAHKSGKDFKGKGGNFRDFKGKGGNFKDSNGKGGNFNSKTQGKFNNTKKPFGKNSGGKPEEDKTPTDWRKFKQEKKDLKLKRKKAKDSYEISVEAKQIYEKLKCRRTEEKSKLVEKLYTLISGGDIIKKLIMAHDTTRIIQCMLKFAAPPMREQISEKLLPLAVEMSTSKYSHFCVLRMLKYGSPKTKSKIVDSLLGNIVKLAGHNISCKILDHIYLTVADAKQKNHMRQEFYGELYRRAKDESIKQLSDAYKETDSMKASILGAVRSTLEHIANKHLLDNSLVHAVLLEFLRECDDDKIEEVVTTFGPLVPLMLTTKEGCQAAIICFYKSTPKNRRAIIKAIKEHLIKICTHEHGHVFMLALLNSLDDTKATKKAIFDSLQPELKTLMSNQWGRRVIEWLVSPAGTNCFHPTFIASLDEGLKYGKKDKEVRRKEIFEQIEEPIVAAIEAEPAFWVSDKHIGLVTADILNKLIAAPFERAATALATVIADPAWTVDVDDENVEKDKKALKKKDVEEIIAEHTKLKKKKQQKAAKVEIVESEKVEGEEGDHDDSDEEKPTDAEETVKSSVAGIEEVGLHVVLKKIIKHDKERVAQDASTQTFGTILSKHLTDDTLNYWLTVNRACFILLNIVENNNDDLKEKLKELLKPHKSTLKKQTTKGAKLLSTKLGL